MTFHGRTEFTVVRNGATYVFGIKFIRDEPTYLEHIGQWMPAEFFISGVHLEEAYSDHSQVMRLPIGWQPVASQWFYDRIENDQAMYESVIGVCEADYDERRG
jgi:hypothetical protein